MVYAIIVAAGQGERMQTATPKQYLLIKDMPVLCYSIKAFERSNADRIVLVVPHGDVNFVKSSILERWGCEKISAVIEGGKTRTESVYNGLKAIECGEDDIVLIHDAARPCIKAELINKVIEEIEENGAAALAVPVKDTIRTVRENGMSGDLIPRESLRAMQTPQGFEYGIIREAYDDAMTNGLSYTDDVELLKDRLGLRTKLVDGEYSNIKITTPEDISIAEKNL